MTISIPDLTSIEIPKRSLFYHLEPIGIGSTMVECLTSYVSRLAEAHCISTGTLVQKEILPRFEKKYLLKSSNLSNFWSANSKAINSTQGWASDWAEILHQITQQNNFQFLTMITWKNVLSSRGLLRNHLIWCPSCYQNWNNSGKVLYIPLLWLFRFVEICPYHHQLLQTSCIKCGRKQSILDRKMMPGYCNFCGVWLGSDISEGTIDEDKFCQQTWIIKMIGELLTFPSSNPSHIPTVKRFSETISDYIEKCFDGSINRMASEIGLTWKTVNRFTQGKQIPQLNTLLHLSFSLGTSPLQLLVDQEEQINCEIDFNSLNLEPYAKQRDHRVVDPIHLKQVLQMYLKEEIPPQSMKNIASLLGYDQSYLAKCFPEICRAITMRYQKYREKQTLLRQERIEQTIVDMVKKLYYQDQYPSYNIVRRNLPKSWFMRESGADEVRKNTIEYLDNLNSKNKKSDHKLHESPDIE